MIHRRLFSTAPRVLQAVVRGVEALPDLVKPHYTPQAKKSLYALTWDSLPRNICVVKKPWNPHVRTALTSFVTFLHKDYPDVNVILEQDTAEEIQPDLDDGMVLYTAREPKDLHAKTDMIVTLGGDGTILHATSLFASCDTVPPILSFSMGTLGFLLPFDVSESREAFHSVYTSQSTVLNRFRLACESATTTKTHAMNDLTIHRGQEPHLTMLDIDVDGELVTTAIADGVTVATPTGSTAYSLSAGGSIVHPSVSCILITPICPRSLSFRPLVFPASAQISISVSPQSRGRAAELSIDGSKKGALKPGDKVSVQAQRDGTKGVWCITRTDSDWVQHLNNLLGFNSTFGDRHYELSHDRMDNKR